MLKSIAAAAIVAIAASSAAQAAAPAPADVAPAATQQSRVLTLNLASSAAPAQTKIEVSGRRCAYYWEQYQCTGKWVWLKRYNRCVGY